MYTHNIHSIGSEVILNATDAGFGVATGPVLIDETRCIGNETRLINCRHNGVGTLNCDHRRDVGLRCRIRELDKNIIIQKICCFYYNYVQLNVLMVMLGWWAVHLTIRVV